MIQRKRKRIPGLMIRFRISQNGQIGRQRHGYSKIMRHYGKRLAPIYTDFLAGKALFVSFCHFSPRSRRLNGGVMSIISTFHHASPGPLSGVSRQCSASGKRDRFRREQEKPRHEQTEQGMRPCLSGLNQSADKDNSSPRPV